jgi:predicted RNA-binding protein with PUA-like domain
MKRRYFLAKTDPETYSVEQFAAEHETNWDGVRNPQALRAIRAMSPGDTVFIYHSMAAAAGVVGYAQVLSEPLQDSRDEKLWTVRLRFMGLLHPPVSLKEIKANGLFEDWSLVRQSRLSTMEAPSAFVEWMQTKFPAITF